MAPIPVCAEEAGATEGTAGTDDALMKLPRRSDLYIMGKGRQLSDGAASMIILFEEHRSVAVLLQRIPQGAFNSQNCLALSPSERSLPLRPLLRLG